jgi:putative ABC transport system permease protein
MSTPSTGLQWSRAMRLAWRDTRASLTKFVFVVTAVAIGVGSLIGVRGFGESFKSMLLREAQNIIASDMSVRVFALPDTKQAQTLKQLESEKLQSTHITETLTMAQVGGGRPVFVSAKAVDPNRYPFYGQVELEPKMPLSQALTASTVVAAADTLTRLGATVGDTVRIGGQDFQIAAIVAKEPDRMAGTMNIGLRLMLSREGLERTSLIRVGSRASQRYLFKLQAGGPTLPNLRKQLSDAFPEGQVIDGTQANPTLTRGLDQSTMFLSLVSLVALIVGALGVAMAMRAHLQQRLDSIAVMKAVGARSGDVIKIFLIQTLMLGLGGGLIGMLIGGAVQMAFPFLIRRYFDFVPVLEVHWISIGQGLTIGILTTLLFTVPTLLGLREIKPLTIFRRDMENTQVKWWQRWRELGPSTVSAVALLVMIGGAAGWLSNSWKAGGYFALAIVISVLLLSAAAWLILRGLKFLLKTPRWALPMSVRHGLANLYRPGNQAGSVLVALGIGVMFTLTVYLLQVSFLKELGDSLPENTPNVFLLDIMPDQKDSVESLLRQQAGKASTVELAPTVALLITEANRVAVKDMKLEGFQRRFLRTRSVSFNRKQPAGVKLLQGKWWPEEAQIPLVSVSEAAAKDLNLKVGQVVKGIAFEQEVEAQVAAVHRVESFRLNAASDFIYTPKTLEGLPAIYFGAVHVQPDRVGKVQRALYEQFPTISAIDINEVLTLIQEVIDQIGLVVRFISGFAILAGIVILASSVASTRLRRIKETVILKSLGGTRARIAQIFSVEFLILGAAAGILGSTLATGFASVLLKNFLEGELLLRPQVLITAVLLSALGACLAGWLASARILSQKPLEILRDE